MLKIDQIETSYGLKSVHVHVPSLCETVHPEMEEGNSPSTEKISQIKRRIWEHLYGEISVGMKQIMGHFHPDGTLPPGSASKVRDKLQTWLERLTFPEEKIPTAEPPDSPNGPEEGPFLPRIEEPEPAT
jgi:hypothetical protein